MARAGWQLTYSEKPTEIFTQDETDSDSTNLNSSIGLRVSGDGSLREVLWDAPSFQVGLAPGMRIQKVNGMPFSTAALLSAVVNSLTSPVILEVRNYDYTFKVTVPYKGTLRYPHLTRLSGSTDRLTPLLAPR